MSLQPGECLGPYEISDLLGRGGMGEVYLARDSRLGRDVAVKVSAARFSDRFEREACAVAALNHPNICTLHDVGPNYLVMELVEGETLAERMKSGPIPLEEAIAIARQIVDALEAAHEKGIVHRDLKPANVKIRQDGTVKVLDFGLAKMPENAPAPTSDPANSPTLTLEVGKLAGAIMGTAGYMAPEQARGGKVDRRADIWAFGVVFYEMLTGQSLFQGETAMDKMASLLAREPDIAHAPARFQTLLRRCLQKDPRKRLGWIGDARYDFDEAPAAVTESRRRPLVIPAFIAVAAFLVAAGFLIRRPVAEERPVRRFTIPAPGLTDAQAPHAQISPDGKHIAYVSSNRLWVRDFDREEPRPLIANDNIQGPFWSPDSRQIGYFARNRLWKTSADTATPVAICAVTGSYYGASWSPDGSLIAFTSAVGLQQVAAAGGEAKLVKARMSGFGPVIFNPNFVLTGDAIVVPAGVQAQQRIYLVSLKTGEASILTEGSNPFVTPDGYLLFTRGAQVLAATFSPQAGLGSPFSAGMKGLASVSRDGTMIAVTRRDAVATRLIVRDKAGKLLRTLGAEQSDMRQLSVSLDGKWAVATSTELGSPDIWIHDLVRGLKSRATFDDGSEAYAKFSPDGKLLAYSGSARGGPDIFVQPADGSGEPLQLTSGPESEFPVDWSTDGRYLVLTGITPTTARDILYLERNPDNTWSKPVVFQRTNFDEQSARISPNGKYLAFRSSEGGEPAIFVRPFPSGPGKWQVSTDGSQPRWSRDGKELYYMSGDVLMAVQVSTNGAFTVGATQRLFSTGNFDTTDVSLKYDVLPDGNFLLVEPVEAENQSQLQIGVVENWLKALRGQNSEKQ